MKFDELCKEAVGGDSKVYVLVWSEPYEGITVYGIYSSFENAKKAFFKAKKEDPSLAKKLSIEVSKLDAAPHHSTISGLEKDILLRGNDVFDLDDETEGHFGDIYRNL